MEPFIIGITYEMKKDRMQLIQMDVILHLLRKFNPKSDINIPKPNKIRVKCKCQFATQTEIPQVYFYKNRFWNKDVFLSQRNY